MIKDVVGGTDRNEKCFPDQKQNRIRIDFMESEVLIRRRRVGWITFRINHCPEGVFNHQIMCQDVFQVGICVEDSASDFQLELEWGEFNELLKDRQRDKKINYLLFIIAESTQLKLIRVLASNREEGDDGAI